MLCYALYAVFSSFRIPLLHLIIMRKSNYTRSNSIPNIPAEGLGSSWFKRPSLSHTPSTGTPPPPPHDRRTSICSYQRKCIYSALPTPTLQGWVLVLVLVQALAWVYRYRYGYLRLPKHLRAS
ncbi:hypothetical protein BT96DRAFT_1024955, partial [Gymnopus androsaceus JB14]